MVMCYILGSPDYVSNVMGKKMTNLFIALVTNYNVL